MPPRVRKHARTRGPAQSGLKTNCCDIAHTAVIANTRLAIQILESLGRGSSSYPPPCETQLRSNPYVTGANLDHKFLEASEGLCFACLQTIEWENSNESSAQIPSSGSGPTWFLRSYGLPFFAFFPFYFISFLGRVVSLSSHNQRSAHRKIN